MKNFIDGIPYNGYTIVKNMYSISYNGKNVGDIVYYTIEKFDGDTHIVYFKSKEEGWKTVASAKTAITKKQNLYGIVFNYSQK